MGDGSMITKLLLMISDNQWTTISELISDYTCSTGSQSIIIDNPHPDVCREPTLVARNDSLFQWTPTKSATGCCPEVQGDQNHGVLASKSVVMPFYILSNGVADLDPI
jgi:hypothetical protein